METRTKAAWVRVRVIRVIPSVRVILNRDKAKPVIKAGSIHQYTVMSAPTTAQYAAITALKEGEEFVREMAEEYDRRRRLIVAGLNRIGLPTFEPKGAFYAFPKVSVTGLDDEAFATRLLQEESVAAVPGNAFGRGGEGFVRCSYATSYEKIEEALRRIERFVNRL